MLAAHETLESHCLLPLLSQDMFFLRSEFQADNNLEPSTSPDDSHTVYATRPKGFAGASSPDTPGITQYAKDDSALSNRPSRQVDYLSHDWEEEDIWSTWRYITSKRGEFANGARLENASWRSWMKTRNSLKTISPEVLNWLKDCDFTWLYGPLQCSRKTDPSSVISFKTNSLINLNKKPILKQRSKAEVILQQSLVPSSPVVRSVSSPNICLFPTKHQHFQFNEAVEQYIAIDIEDDSDDLEQDGADDDNIKMERVSVRKQDSSKKRNNEPANSDTKLIRKLSSTTLERKCDHSETRANAMMHRAATSPSQKSPCRNALSSSFIIVGECNKYDCFSNECLMSSSGSPSPSRGHVEGDLHPSPSLGGLIDEPVDIRPTPSSTMMPSEENEAPTGDGMMSRAINAMNIASDMARTVWNVGRKE